METHCLGIDFRPNLERFGGYFGDILAAFFDHSWGLILDADFHGILDTTFEHFGVDFRCFFK